MGVIKAKNSAGEWVNVASAEATTITNEIVGELKTAVITAKDAYTFDLSDYVAPGDNFIFFFKSTTNSSVSAGELCVLEKIGETVRKAHWNTNMVGMGWWSSKNDVVMTDLFPDDWNFEGTWDDATCTLTFPTYGASSYGLLLYTDVKEA